MSKKSTEKKEKLNDIGAENAKDIKKQMEDASFSYKDPNLPKEEMYDPELMEEIKQTPGGKLVIWNSLTARHRPLRAEPPTQKPSDTVPGQDMTVAEILRRYLSGQSIDTQSSQPIYHNGLIHPSFYMMDKTEKAQFLNDASRKLDTAEAALKSRQKEMEKAEYDAQMAELESLRKQMQEKKSSELSESSETSQS